MKGLYFVVVVTLFLVVSLGIFGNSEISEVETQCSEELLLRQGKIPEFSKNIYLTSIDKGKTWLIVTPTREVYGYLHKKLPDYKPTHFEKVSKFDHGRLVNSNFYYFGL